MRRSFGERLVVNLFGSSFDFFASVLDETSLPFVLFFRWARGKLPMGLAWGLFWDTWAPFRRYRRWSGIWQVKRDRAYKGQDEFHPSMSMRIEAMLEITKCERDEYLADLSRRWMRLHEADMLNRHSLLDRKQGN